MTVAWILVGLWAAVLSAPAGWIMGVQIGDSRGLLGYVAAALAILAGIAAGFEL